MKNSTYHAGEMAELYALGSLSAEETEQLQRHVVQCAECRKRVSDAEQAVTAMIEADEVPGEAPAVLHRLFAQPLRPRRAFVPAAWGALAAALVLWIVPASWFYSQSARESASVARQDVAMHALVHSHFLHVQLSALAPGAPSAKAIYARTGAWVYVLVDAPSQGLSIGTMQQSRLRVLGQPSTLRGSSAFYYDGPSIDNVVLLKDGKVLERAKMIR